MRSRQSERAPDHPGNCGFRDAWGADVCLEGRDGNFPECASARRIYNCNDRRVSEKALFPIYTYVFINGLFAGFATWWIPYLYLWTVLWGVTMLLPRNMNPKLCPIVYMAVCAAHGFLFGTLYAPAQALLFGLDFKAMLAWIVAGLPWDFVHGVSNFFCGLLIVPMIQTLKLADKVRS